MKDKSLQILTAPGLVQQPDGMYFRLDAPLQVRLPGGRNIVVEKGFKTDLASIPPLGVVGGLVMLAGFIFMLAAVHFMVKWPVLAGGGLGAIGMAICFISAYLKPYGRYTYAAVLHDWLYKTHFASFTVCNWYLLLAMRQEKTARWERFLIWFNVQLFGWFFYYNKKRQVEHAIERVVGHTEHYGGKHHLSHKG